MNLLLLDQFSDPGGAQHGLLDTLAAVKSRGWHALVGLPGDGELFGRVRAMGFRVERIKCGPYHSGSKSAADAMRFITDTPLLAGHIRRMAKQVDADLIYANGPRLLPAAALARIPKPLVFHAHSLLFPGRVRQLAGLALRHSDALVVGSCQFVAEPWKPYVAPNRISIIYNGVVGPGNSDVPIEPKPRSGPPHIGCIGRIAREKGQRDFVEVARIVNRAIPECRFSVIGAPLFSGDSYESEVHAAAEGLPIAFPGWIDGIYTALAGLDLLLVPSAPHEATTRVILEAFAAGVPVIAYASGGIPEVVDNGVNGYLVSGVQEMADAVIRALRSGGAATSIAARETWARRFTLDRYQEEIAQRLWKIHQPK